MNIFEVWLFLGTKVQNRFFSEPDPIFHETFFGFNKQSVLSLRMLENFFENLHLKLSFKRLLNYLQASVLS